jgi:hypothetical protein
MNLPPPGSYDWANDILERTPWRLVSAYRSGTITARFPAMARKVQESRRQQKPRVRPPDALLITPTEAARKLRCSSKTLNGYVASGALRYVAIGHGPKRPRRMFTDADLDNFIANQTRKDVPCLSTSTETVDRRISTLTSKCEVVGFTARRNARRAAKPKK